MEPKSYDENFDEISHATSLSPASDKLRSEWQRSSSEPSEEAGRQRKRYKQTVISIEIPRFAYKKSGSSRSSYQTTQISLSAAANRSFQYTTQLTHSAAPIPKISQLEPPEDAFPEQQAITSPLPISLSEPLEVKDQVYQVHQAQLSIPLTLPQVGPAYPKPSTGIKEAATYETGYAEQDQCEEESNNASPVIYWENREQVPSVSGTCPSTTKEDEEPSRSLSQTDFNSTFSSVVSTVMMLADGRIPIPEAHARWTSKFLNLVRDGQGRTPTNITGILWELNHRSVNDSSAESPSNDSK